MEDIALQICIYTLFLISIFFGVKGFKEIDKSLKVIDAGLSSISLLVGIILLLKQFG